jgi:hypothetical protein
MYEFYEFKEEAAGSEHRRGYREVRKTRPSFGV